MTTTPLTARALADAWVDTLADLDPSVGTALGIRPGDTRMPDLSPDALTERAGAARAVLRRLPDAVIADDDDRRCATLLRERLEAGLAVHETGADLASLRPIGSPVQSLQSIFTLMPTRTVEDREILAARLEAVPDAAASYRVALAEGLARDRRSAPRQARVVADQLGAWLADADGQGWHAGLVAGVEPEGTALRARMDAAAARCAGAVADLRGWITGTYLPAVADVPDAVGPDAYRVAVRHSLGANVDPHEAYAWGWEELARIESDMRAEAERVLPGSTPAQALAHLDVAGEAIEGVEQVREHLQHLMDTAIAELDGTVMDIPAGVRRVEARIAPPGAAAAPYYTRPSLDLTRPGRTWLPTLGRTRFPIWDLVSTWYHEGVPGHHLQLGTWATRSAELSRFQVAVGSVPANTEGWALYAERLMDDLGYLRTPGERLGYLDAQRMRAVRVVIDIGMHLGLTIPRGVLPAAESGLEGRVWTADLARAFFAARSGSPEAFIVSEVERYLGWPGQAISYKLGERAWLAGRAAARSRREAAGETFDLRAWHNAALGLGSLGLSDLERELSGL